MDLQTFKAWFDGFESALEFEDGTPMFTPEAWERLAEVIRGLEPGYPLVTYPTPDQFPQIVPFCGSPSIQDPDESGK